MPPPTPTCTRNSKPTITPMKAPTSSGVLLLLLLLVGGGGVGWLAQASGSPEVVAPFSFRDNVTTSSVDLAWLPPQGQVVSKYEVQGRQVARTASGSDLSWKLMSSDVLGLNLGGEGVMTPGAGVHEVQDIETRADAGTPITSGYFRISFSSFLVVRFVSALISSCFRRILSLPTLTLIPADYAGKHGFDPETLTETGNIPFDATPSAMEIALSGLVNLELSDDPHESLVVQVVRTATAVNGGYKWTVAFDEGSGRSLGDVPMFIVRHVNFPGATFTGGGGDLVTVREVRKGRLPTASPLACNERVLQLDDVGLVSGIQGTDRAQLVKSLERPRGSGEDSILTACVQRITGLSSFTQYQFRVRAYSEASATWGPWSASSSVFRTLFVGPPGKIAAPLFSSSSASSVSVYFEVQEKALTYDVEYRPVSFVALFFVFLHLCFLFFVLPPSLPPSLTLSPMFPCSILGHIRLCSKPSLRQCLRSTSALGMAARTQRKRRDATARHLPVLFVLYVVRIGDCKGAWTGQRIGQRAWHELVLPVPRTGPQRGRGWTME